MLHCIKIFAMTTDVTLEGAVLFLKWNGIQKTIQGKHAVGRQFEPYWQSKVCTLCLTLSDKPQIGWSLF